MASSSESSDEDLEKFAAIAGIVDTGNITLVFLWKYVRLKILQLSLIFWKHCLFLFLYKHHLEVSKKCNSDNSRGSSKPHTKPSLRLVLAVLFSKITQDLQKNHAIPYFYVDQNFISPCAFSDIIGFPRGWLPGHPQGFVFRVKQKDYQSPRVWGINSWLNTSPWDRDLRIYVQYLLAIRPLKRKMCAQDTEKVQDSA